LEASDNYNNQSATGATKAGSGWQESIDKVTTRPRRWATTNNNSNKEGKGGKGDGDGNEGGGQGRGQGQ
jgi:hypothetical protein